MGPLGRAFSDLAAQVAALAGTRLELFGLEARDAGDRLLCRLAALLAAAVFLLLALLVATLALALVFWPTEYRFLALSLLALLYAVLGAGLAGWLIHRLRHDPDPFAVTAEVLREDAGALAGTAEPPAHGGGPSGRAVASPPQDDPIPEDVP
ncbi:phage holin family protein [Castellaniella sp. WN]